MTDHDTDDILSELDAALSVEPSRKFADGVRTKVRQSQMRTTHVWWGLAAAAGISFAVVAFWRPATETPASIVQFSIPGQVAPPVPSTVAVTNPAPATVVEKSVP